jgi:hypothetical protein
MEDVARSHIAQSFVIAAIVVVVHISKLIDLPDEDQLMMREKFHDRIKKLTDWDLPTTLLEYIDPLHLVQA